MFFDFQMAQLVLDIFCSYYFALVSWALIIIIHVW